jgi:hypothetical protein
MQDTSADMSVKGLVTERLHTLGDCRKVPLLLMTPLANSSLLRTSVFKTQL